MKIKVQISFKEYICLMYSITYKKPVMILLICVATVMLLWILAFHLEFFPVPEPTRYQYFTLVLITVIQPLFIFNTLRRNYYSNNHLKETVEIEFTESEVIIAGHSFYTELLWKKLFKIVELKGWYLIYQNTLSAVLVPKKSLHPKQSQEIRAILRSISNVPVHLKKTEHGHA